MIEINLLPEVYRPRDKTNVPLMLTVAVGMLVVGAIILWGIELNRTLATRTSEAEVATKERDQLKKSVEKVKLLRAKIARQEARQITIVDISQSKVMWSLKLQQLSSIMERFPNFWVKRLSLSKVKGGGALKMEISATGSNLREVARFRDALKADANFAYHFGPLEGYQVRIVKLPANMNFKEKMDLSLTLPLKSWQTGKKKRK